MPTYTVITNSPVLSQSLLFSSGVVQKADKCGCCEHLLYWTMFLCCEALKTTASVGFFSVFALTVLNNRDTKHIGECYSALLSLTKRLMYKDIMVLLLK